MKRTKENLRYPVSLKEKIGRAYLTGKYSYGKLAELYGLADKQVVVSMVKWYKKSINFEEIVSIMEESKASPEGELFEEQGEPSVEVKDLLSRIKELESALYEEHLRRSSIEVLLDISVEETGYHPRKKMVPSSKTNEGDV